MLKKLLLLICWSFFFIILSFWEVFGSIASDRAAEKDWKPRETWTEWTQSYKSCTGEWVRKKTGELWQWCINSTEFYINTNTLSPWSTADSKWKLLWSNKWLDGSTDKTVNRILWNIIQKMITIMWVIALFIMTIGWWYMIFHMWEESLLSRWKTIFMWGLISLVVALSAWLLVQLVTYLLY